MKSTTDLWYSPNTGATNESGFSALPGGFRYYNGGFDSKGYNAYFWSTTEYYGSSAWYWYLGHYFADVIFDMDGKTTGYSVRCVREIPPPAWSCGNPMTDIRDNQTYTTVQIGTQCWMAENLNVGTIIQGNTNMANNGIPEKYCYNNSTANCDVYGGLYQWNEMMQFSTTPGAQGLCPTGWHIPADEEWTILTTFLGGESIAGGEMKSTGTIEAGTGLWYAPNGGATNSSGFSALPGGIRFFDSSFGYLGYTEIFSSSTEFDANYHWGRYLSSDFPQIFKSSYYYKNDGYSARCVKD